MDRLQLKKYTGMSIYHYKAPVIHLQLFVVPQISILVLFSPFLSISASAFIYVMCTQMYQINLANELIKGSFRILLADYKLERMYTDQKKNCLTNVWFIEKCITGQIQHGGGDSQ